jgi:hypothetical protein
MIKKYTICIFLFSSSLFAEERIDFDRIEYLKNFSMVKEYKKNMPFQMLEYYTPRKRFIDRQSVNPASYPFYQIHILSKGTYLRGKYSQKNLSEIKKLEKFLEKADDFQLGRYFGDFEEIYLRSKAKKSIQHICEAAERDEKWRLKNDPIFAKYLSTKATVREKKFYSQNKSLFYGELTGKSLVLFLKEESRVFSGDSLTMR